METFGERLESLRNGMTQKEFAASLQTPINTYTNWVRGIREPSMSALVNLCTHLSVSADWLLGLSDNSFTAVKESAQPTVNAPNNGGAIAIGGGNAVSRDCLECPLLKDHLKRFSKPR